MLFRKRTTKALYSLRWCAARLHFCYSLVQKASFLFARLADFMKGFLSYLYFYLLFIFIYGRGQLPFI